MNVPVVQTVHNFRLLCPGVTFYRDGHIWEDCVSKLKNKYGYRPDDKVLLFIGRLIDEKQLVRMIDILWVQEN